MNYLLDICVVSDFFRKIPSVLKHFEAVSPKQLHISSITVMEIEYGLKNNLEIEKKLRPLWENLLKQIMIIPYSAQCAEATASIRAKLKSAGLPIGPYDILIAGSAMAHGMAVVTSNLDEFKRIAGIHIEDWKI